MCFQCIFHNNTPSKAIVNAASNITYRPLIEADDTGRCTLIIWPIFGTRLISLKWGNYLNSFSNKTVTISLDRRKKWIKCHTIFVFNNTIIVQVRYIIIETKEVARNGYSGFLFPHSYSRGKKPSFYPIRATSFVSIIMYLMHKCSSIDIFHIFFFQNLI